MTFSERYPGSPPPFKGQPLSFLVQSLWLLAFFHPGGVIWDMPPLSPSIQFPWHLQHILFLWDPPISPSLCHHLCFTVVGQLPLNTGAQSRLGLSALPPDKKYAMLAFLFHHDLDTSLLMQYLGNNYTRAYREVSSITNTLHGHTISLSLINKYTRVMLTGCSTHFIAKTTGANALMHWCLQNHPSIDKNLQQVLSTMNREDRIKFIIPLLHWIAWFTLHLFYPATYPQEGRKERPLYLSCLPPLYPVVHANQYNDVHPTWFQRALPIWFC